MRDVGKPYLVKNKKLVKTTTFVTAIMIASLLLFSSIGAGSLEGTVSDPLKINYVNNGATSRANNALSLASNQAPDGQTNPTTAPLGIPLLQEGFEGTTFPPENWTRIQTNPGPGSGSIPPYWSRTNYDYHSGGWAAGLWWDYSHQDEWLITKPVNLTGSTTGNYYVTFWTYGYEGSIYGDHYYVKISNDGGTTWQILLDLSTLTGNAWNDWEYPYTLNLNDWEGDTIKIAWHAEDPPSNDGLWYIWIIDDIEIGYFDVPDNDVGVTSIQAPVSGTATGPIKPKVTVENFGLLDQTNVPVNVNIIKYGTPTDYWCDGFECYTPGRYVMPCGWTVQTTNPTGTWFMYASGTTYSAATYPRVQEALSDGNAQDESLISPTIDCSGLSWVHVQFTKYFYASAALDATFTLYISVGGGAWTQLFQYTTTSSVAENINVTTYAAGQSDVKFRFRFESPADASLSSYLYFDNFWVGAFKPFGPLGDNPPVGWDIQNYPTNPPTWNNNYWNRRTTVYTAYDSMYFPAQVYYTTPYVDVDCALITPSIDCSGLSTVNLYINGYFYLWAANPGRGYIEMSIGGGPWVEILALTASTTFYEWDGAGNNYNNIPLPGAAGQSDVKIRFRYEHTAAEQGRYWYLSNVRVGSDRCNIIFRDSFQGKQAYSTNFKIWQPDDWCDWAWIPIEGTSTGNRWQNLLTGTSPACSPYEGLRMAQYNSFSATSGNSALLYKKTPVDVSTATALKVGFYMYHDTGTGNDKIQVMADTGSDFQAVGDPIDRKGTVNTWSYHVVDLPLATQIRIGFLGISAYGYNMYIDKVCIFDPGYITEYNQIEYVNVPAGQSVVKEFTVPWTPATWQTQEDITVTYDIIAETQLTTDQNPDNDGVLSTIQLYFPLFYDVEVVEILSPTSDGDAKPLPVKATIKNIGQFRVRNFFVNAAIGSSTARSVQEDFSTAVVPNMPVGWNINNAKWATVNSANAGGTAPEARFYFSPSETGQFRMYCDPFNTVGQTEITLTFRHMVNHYTTPYTLKVETSTDGGQTWSYTPWSITPTASIAATQVTVPLTSAHGVGSAQFAISFTFDGYSWNINYWYVDNIVCGTLPPIVDAEYDESAAVAAWLYPGESRDLEWITWEPENLIDPQESGQIKYTINVENKLSDNPLYPDGNSANDLKSKTFKLKYWHDVLVKQVTQPVIDKEITWLHFDDGTNVNSIGLTAGGTFYYGIRLTPAELSGHGDDELTTVRHHHGWWESTSAPSVSGTVYIRDQNTPTMPGDIITSQPYTTGSVPGWEEYTLTSPVTIDEDRDLWVIFSVTHAAGQYPAGVGPGPMVAGKGGWISLDGTTWEQIAGYGLDYNWNMWAGVEAGGPGPGGINVYIAPGTKPMQAIVRNAGTFAENGLTCYADLYEFVTDPNGTLVYEYDYTGINLVALGGEKTLDLGSWNFNLEGIYGLYLDIPLASDDFPGNNQKYYGIGVDNTPPVTTHTLTPGTPNGDNGWYVTSVKVKLQFEDPEVNGVASGLESTWYKLNDDTWKPYTAEITASEEGENVVKYYSIDNVGNQESEKTVTFNIDTVKPTIMLTKEKGVNKMTFTAEVSDETSGINRVEFFLNAGPVFTDTEAPYEWTLSPIPNVEMTCTAVVYDNAGNSAEESVTFALSNTHSMPGNTVVRISRAVSTS